MKKLLGIKRLISFAVALLLLFRVQSLTIFADGGRKSDDEGPKEDVIEVIRNGFYSFSEEVDISEHGVSPRDLGKIFSYILKDDPYLFFVDRSLSYSFVPGGNVICLKPRYMLSGIEIFDAWGICRDYVRDVARLAMEKKSELERVLFVHNYICENFSYDEGFLNDDIYKMVTRGKGTCQGYADLYSAILRECGIESHFVASDTVGHIWNYVKIDGVWYHSDVTWDDLDDGYRHRHFLLTDAAATERGHRDWYSAVEVTCDARTYDDGNVEKILHSGYCVGDIDHSGEVELVDLLVLRRMLEYGENAPACEKCADMDLSGGAGREDLELLREKIVKSLPTD